MKCGVCQLDTRDIHFHVFIPKDGKPGKFKHDWACKECKERLKLESEHEDE